ncbi:FimD/PapC N-terminal domain-containing protein [Providencia hangzhouensis]|uniref:FimD/PapC N-terminal domain-containing protein n=1 Tax=Providencia hangzhouensis TaxID=3031799 RepID=UPI0034DD7764
MYFKKKKYRLYYLTHYVWWVYKCGTFNINALNLSADDNIDLSYFEKNSLSERLYESDIILKFIKKLSGEKIKFINHDEIEPCITAQLIKRFPLNEEAKEILLSAQENDCINLFSLDKNVGLILMIANKS